MRFQITKFATGAYELFSLHLFTVVSIVASFFMYLVLNYPKRNDTHSLSLMGERYFLCTMCSERCNGFYYECERCHLKLDVQCSLTSNTLAHACHEHPLYLSITNNTQKCSICGSEQYRVFRCTICEFVLDFKCATLPQTA